MTMPPLNVKAVWNAVKMYRDYLKTGSALDEQSLIDYCKADSMAMVALLKWYQTIACD